MLWMALFLRVLPATMLALAGTVVGLEVLAGLIPTWGQLPVGILALVFLAALLTFREARGWNVALLLGMALTVGTYLGGAIQLGESLAWGKPLATAGGALIVAALLGRALRGRLHWMGVAAWLLSWLYLAGWPVALLLRPPADFAVFWAAAGLIIFTALAASWFASLGERAARTAGVALGAELYILSLNLAAALWMMGAAR